MEQKKLPDGKENPKYVDLMEEDPPFPGMKYVCLSFISPEKLLKRREHFIFEKFVQTWDFSKSMSKFHDFLNYMAYKYHLSIETLLQDYTEFVEEEKSQLASYSIDDDWHNFMDKKEDECTLQFSKLHQFQTSTRGIKVRGAFNTQEEAEMYTKKLREMDPSHDIFVGPVGIWLPWDPDAYKTGRIEFMEDQLNQLHHEKLKNEAKAKEAFEQRIRDAKRKAIEENIKLAQQTNNKLTQSIDEKGNLYGVMESVDFESREVAEPKTEF